ncbi:hypothetical protein ACP_2374 [Acidobacterium capsulatum ATCC 51196]|uniref:Uncharacterized protein n=1 Tax=Acidobacterium capsulatum (strain ATCC 51196 / DSM 11244 / BCRC 80197 / JCM 7670 / NBRC 15755 / NCIMB 13165 / 161) TaxID=240015 RepID=C1F171_ACIC5|nr:hypothetical protein ACP_2374 [Acidobacterium capsulatum ATCC 51196]
MKPCLHSEQLACYHSSFNAPPYLYAQPLMELRKGHCELFSISDAVPLPY